MTTKTSFTCNVLDVDNIPEDELSRLMYGLLTAVMENQTSPGIAFILSVKEGGKFEALLNDLDSDSCLCRGGDADNMHQAIYQLGAVLDHIHAKEEECNQNQN